MTRPSRVSRAKILEQLRLAGRKGDRTALALAAEQMKTLAYSPRYWEKYLDLLTSPLARLVDMLLIKQGDKIAHQKGWVARRKDRAPRGAGKGTKGGKGAGGAGQASRRPRRRASPPEQQPLFPDLPA